MNINDEVKLLKGVMEHFCTVAAALPGSPPGWTQNIIDARDRLAAMDGPEQMSTDCRQPNHIGDATNMIGKVNGAPHEEQAGTGPVPSQWTPTAFQECLTSMEGAAKFHDHVAYAGFVWNAAILAALDTLGIDYPVAYQRIVALKTEQPD